MLLYCIEEKMIEENNIVEQGKQRSAIYRKNLLIRLEKELEKK